MNPCVLDYMVLGRYSYKSQTILRKRREKYVKNQIGIEVIYTGTRKKLKPKIVAKQVFLFPRYLNFLG